MPTLKGGGLYSPHISIISGKSAVNIYSASTETFTCTFSEDGKLVPPTPTGQPTDEIWYTSTDGEIVKPYNTEEGEPISEGEGEDVFGANILSNTYADGKGIIKFDGDVTMIGEEAFSGYYTGENLKTISLPNSIMYLENMAIYGCENLTLAKMPNHPVTCHYQVETFEECPNLPKLNGIPYTSLNLEDNPWALLSDDSEEEIGELLSGIQYLYDTYDCNSTMTAFTVPNSVISLGAGTFCGTSLKSITIPSSVIHIDAFVFGKSMPSFYDLPLTGFTGSHTGISTDHRCIGIDGVIKGFASKGLTSYVIPSMYTSIDAWAFQNASYLTSITIPDTITSIGEYAFSFITKTNYTVYCNAITPPTYVSGKEEGPMFNSKYLTAIYVPAESVEAYKAATGWSTYADKIVAQS